MEIRNRADTKVSQLNWDLFCLWEKHPNPGNVIQPSILFPVNLSLIWNEIPDYTADIRFLPEQGL